MISSGLKQSNAVETGVLALPRAIPQCANIITQASNEERGPLGWQARQRVSAEETHNQPMALHLRASHAMQQTGRCPTISSQRVPSASRRGEETTDKHRARNKHKARAGDEAIANAVSIGRTSAGVTHTTNLIVHSAGIERIAFSTRPWKRGVNIASGRGVCPRRCSRYDCRTTKSPLSGSHRLAGMLYVSSIVAVQRASPIRN